MKHRKTEIVRRFDDLVPKETRDTGVFDVIICTGCTKSSRFRSNSSNDSPFPFLLQMRGWNGRKVTRGGRTWRRSASCATPRRRY